MSRHFEKPTLHEAQEALTFVSPDVPREQWVTTAMAIKSEFGDSGFDVWNEWSQGGQSYSKTDASQTWKSISPGGGVTIASLFGFAKEAGYKHARSDTDTRVERGIPKAKQTPQKPQTVAPISQVQADASRSIWESATQVPVDHSHPYLAAKRVGALGIRVADNGNLVLPLFNKNLEVVAYQQFGIPTGDRENPYRTQNQAGGLGDAFFLYGKPMGSKIVYVAEGYATGATVSQITGMPFAVACGSQRLEVVGRQLRAMYPGVKIVFLADDDWKLADNTGVNKATFAAAQVGGFVATPTFDENRPDWATDFNDLLRLSGVDSVKACIANPVDPEADLIKTYTYDPDVMKPVEYVIDGFLSTGITLIAGAPGVGKTTSMVSAAAVAAGLVECDKPNKSTAIKATLRRKVFYVTEDPLQVDRIMFGLKRREIIKKSASEIRDWFEIISARRMPPDELKKLLSKMIMSGTRIASDKLNNYPCKPLVILDTSNATLDLDNENDNAEAGKAIAAIKEVLNDSPLWLAGHTAKTQRDAVEGANFSFRGAGAFEGDANAVTYLCRETKESDADNGVRLWMLGKHRFESEFAEVQINTEADSEVIKTPWGMDQSCGYRVGVISRSSKKIRNEGKAKLIEAMREEEAKERDTAFRKKVFAILKTQEAIREPISKSDLKKAVGGQAAVALAVINDMQAEGHLVSHKSGKAINIYTKEHHRQHIAGKMNNGEMTKEKSN